MYINLPFSGSTGTMQVLWLLYVVSFPASTQGLPWVVQRPMGESAVAYWAGLGFHPVHPEVIR